MQVGCFLLLFFLLLVQLVVPSIIEKSNVNTISTIRQQTNTNTKSIFPFSSSSSTTESIWKCPCCTKEHSAQTPSCSLCHGVNPNYKKLSSKLNSIQNENNYF
jgi:hypothetical protein